MNENNKISRRKFIQNYGSILAGGSIVGISAFLVSKSFNMPENALNRNPIGDGLTLQQDAFKSPYKLVSSFSIPDHVDAFELSGDHLVVATSNNIFIYDRMGSLVDNIAIGSNLRDIAIDQDEIYLLFPSRIEVYNMQGEWLRDWEACSDLSDYCSMTVVSEAVFVTDVANKNICKYTTEGNFVRFIQSPNDFIIPSYSFGITNSEGIVYCSNPGRHKVEKYTLDGDYIGSFGKPGGVTGMFCGCCNPVHLATTTTGDIITSEKGNPRISCYNANGEFQSLLLDSKSLGGGNTAYDIKVHGDKLFVAGKNMISTFQYDRLLAAKTTCSDCGKDCPLRKGITI